MKRPLALVGLVMTLATLSAFFFSPKDGLLVSVAFAVTALFMSVLKRPYLRIPMVVCITAAVALALHVRYDAANIQPFYSASGETVIARGIITDGRIATSRRVHYTFNATFPHRPDLPDTTLRLRSYGEMDFVAGDVILCEIILEPEPSDSFFPQQPEYSLCATIVGTPQKLSRGYPLYRRLISLRQKAANNLYMRLDETTADIISGMVLGQQDNIKPEIYSSLGRAGIIHLLSVSGMHLSILATLLRRCLQSVKAPKKLQAALTVIILLLFVVMVGFSSSVVRSLIMSLIMLTAHTSKRRGDSITSLGFAALIICLIWPSWVLSRGFWLSVSATLGIMLFTDPLCKLIWRYTGHPKGRFINIVIQGAAVSIAAFGATFPLSIAFYGWVSVLSLPADLLVSPFVPIVIISGLATAFLPGSSLPVRLISTITEICTKAILEISEIISAIPFATLTLDKGWMLIWMALIVAVAVLFAVFRPNRRLVASAVSALIVVFCAGQLSYSMNWEDATELAILKDCSVAVLIRGSEAVVVGTPNKYDINKLMRYMEFRGTQNVRAIVASDCSEQIGSGLTRICQRYPVDCIIGPNDDYILGQIATAIPNVPVYSGGYATLEVLGGLDISLTLPDGDMFIYSRANTVLKSSSKYDIISSRENSGYTIGMFDDYALHLNGASGEVPSPLGGMLFGERRFLLYNN